jgi:hypothetical protein
VSTTTAVADATLPGTQAESTSRPAALIADGNHARADGVSAGIILSMVFIAVVPGRRPHIWLLVTGPVLQAAWESWVTIRGG